MVLLDVSLPQKRCLNTLDGEYFSTELANSPFDFDLLDKILMQNMGRNTDQLKYILFDCPRVMIRRDNHNILFTSVLLRQVLGSFDSLKSWHHYLQTIESMINQYLVSVRSSTSGIQKPVYLALYAGVSSDDSVLTGEGRFDLLWAVSGSINESETLRQRYLIL